MTYFHIGNISIPGVWLAAFLALVISSLLFRGIMGKNVEEWFWNGAFLYFLTWKLSYVLFNFDLFMETPLSIIFFNGGTKGHYLALIILSVYLIFIAGKKNTSIYDEAPQIFLLFFLSYEVGINLLEDSITQTYVHIGVLAGYLSILILLKKGSINLSSQLFILMIMLELLVLSIFQPILERETLTFLWMSITMLLISKIRRRQELE
jgi:hypothetical protein